MATHQDKAEDINKLKNTTQLNFNIFHAVVSLLSRHAKLSNLEDHVISSTEIQ